MYIAFGFIFVFNLIDLIFGLLKAIKLKNFKSSKMKNGLIEKSYIMLLYWTIILFELFANKYNIQMKLTFLSLDLTISKFYAIATILNQISSIFENISKTYPKILPLKLVEIFENLKNEK